MTKEKQTCSLDRSAVDVGEALVQDGKRWISAVAVADIWNYRARVEYGIEGANYTRFSVRGRREYQRRKGEVTDRSKAIGSISIPLGHLERHFYNEEDAWTIPLAPHANTRQISARGIKKDPVSGQFLPKSETDTKTS